MKVKKNILLIVLVFSLFFLGINLSWLFQKENFDNITFFDFKYAIGPFLSSVALFIAYVTAIKKENKNNRSNN
ncbi:hypothetical protein SOM12_15655 [Flavobacterium sp. CFBP9031]|uniref:hypothetical protein n=1 Tax=Flavobacterium sp. CFBP9031 TaxID=3096538 RepID=UPI002A6B608F|nr:hypothetical protein [Flavobacterium sp. CFBP9031]MDY0988868.1 hypothetical protein [Flavobacterium sp. CFBP9031]